MFYWDLNKSCLPPVFNHPCRISYYHLLRIWKICKKKQLGKSKWIIIHVWAWQGFQGKQYSFWYPECCKLHILPVASRFQLFAGHGWEGRSPDPQGIAGINPLSWPQPPITKSASAFEQQKLLYKMDTCTCSMSSLMSEICPCAEAQKSWCQVHWWWYQTWWTITATAFIWLWWKKRQVK